MTLPSLSNLKVPSSFLLNTTNVVGVVVDRSSVLTMTGRSHLQDFLLVLVRVATFIIVCLCMAGEGMGNSK